MFMKPHRLLSCLLLPGSVHAARRPCSAAATRTGYNMHHPSHLDFIDRKGMQRALMPFGRHSDEMVHDLAILLKQ